jgi:hypothetical protein
VKNIAFSGQAPGPLVARPDGSRIYVGIPRYTFFSDAAKAFVSVPARVSSKASLHPRTDPGQGSLPVGVIKQRMHQEQPGGTPEKGTAGEANNTIVRRLNERPSNKRL